MSVFTASMRFIGDFDDEFYADERQRDVWNESAAVGFSLYYYGTIVGAAVLPWTGGRTGAWIALAMLLFTMVVNFATGAYAKSKDVDMFAEARWFQLRNIVVGVLMLVGFVGIGVTLAPEKYLPSEASMDTWAGLIVGAIVGGGAVALMIRRSKRRKVRFESELD